MVAEPTDDDEATPTITILRVIKQKRGIRFAQGDDSKYYVGINCYVGNQFTHFNHFLTDLLVTSEYDVADRYFRNHTEGT